VITYNQFKLDNGLTVIHHLDSTKASAVLNILYNVGARDESPDKTGFAHLFEHLMFGGSENIPSYDSALQQAGGTNNAFTSNDITNYYIEIPVQNIETAFWLESDRMKQLAFSQESLNVQKGVVVEEFKQRYLNQPYGKAFMQMRENAYKSHPYRWATIGKEIKHIEDAHLDDVKAFFNQFYKPSNAVMCVAGNITYEDAKQLSTKWFGDIKAGEPNKNRYTPEPVQTQERRTVALQENPQQALYLAFHKSSVKDQDHYVADLMADILTNGKNSYLYARLIQNNPIFTSISAYCGDELDPGLFYIIGKVNNKVTLALAETKLWECIESFKTEMIEEQELTRKKNKLITTKTYHETNLLNKAMSLCIYYNLGDIELVNNSISRYNLVSVTDIKNLSNTILTKNNCTTLVYDKITQ
jgi:zinc protease